MIEVLGFVKIENIWRMARMVLAEMKGQVSGHGCPALAD